MNTQGCGPGKAKSRWGGTYNGAGEFSVAAVQANVFRKKNGISVGKRLAKNLKKNLTK
jgi:hypothetical protein